MASPQTGGAAAASNNPFGTSQRRLVPTQRQKQAVEAAAAVAQAARNNAANGGSAAAQGMSRKLAATSGPPKSGMQRMWESMGMSSAKSAPPADDLLQDTVTVNKGGAMASRPSAPGSRACAACDPRTAEPCLDLLGGDAMESRGWHGMGDVEAQRRALGSQKSLGERQPLLPGRPRKPPPVKALCGAPLGVFLASSVAFTFLWQIHPIPILLSLIVSGMALHLSLPSEKALAGPLGKGDLLPVGIIALAVISGSATGLYAHERHASVYYASALGREYSDVKASSPGAAYADAGKITFASSSSVDVNKALGFKNGHRYCVAPVVDTSNPQNRHVNFWAVGMDCCGPRKEFTCGNVGDSGSRGGVRVANDGLLEEPSLGFRDAINQAAAVYDFYAPTDEDWMMNDVILLHWVKDPSGVQTGALFSAFGTILVGAFLFVLVALAIMGSTMLNQPP